MSVRHREKETDPVNQVKKFFATKPGFEFEKVAGSGMFGVTLCYLDKKATARGFQRIAVKVPTNSDETAGFLSESSMTQERKVLQRLGWAKHIVTLIAPAFEAKDAKWINNKALITEYLENGTLHSLRTRLKERQTDPPDLTRACVGMAYPPGLPHVLPKRPRSQLNESLNGIDIENPGQLMHNDLHDENIMIGDMDALEHSFFPIVKIIDFGQASELEGEGAVEDNISAIGNIMKELIWGSRLYVDFLNNVPFKQVPDPNLDEDLAALVTQCINGIPDERPSLRELLATIRPKLKQKYPDNPEETDEYITDLVQRNLLDAD
ncbi:kinase-like domain-containing protein [Astrocystis sublimbata]|nr:kinase-like domain-containing protein [Astrocystis sublimbata]